MTFWLAAELRFAACGFCSFALDFQLSTLDYRLLCEQPLPLFSWFFFAARRALPGHLEVYFIDVEGGQATLFVSPSGESMLVDTGWPDAQGRDAERIVAAARLAGVKQIDYLVVTHYHMDHVGGVPQLAARIPIRTFVDHGPSVEHDAEADQLFAAYIESARQRQTPFGETRRGASNPGNQGASSDRRRGRDLQSAAGSGRAQPALRRSKAQRTRTLQKMPSPSGC